MFMLFDHIYIILYNILNERVEVEKIGRGGRGANWGADLATGEPGEL